MQSNHRFDFIATEPRSVTGSVDDEVGFQADRFATGSSKLGVPIHLIKNRGQVKIAEGVRGELVAPMQVVHTGYLPLCTPSKRTDRAPRLLRVPH